MPIKRKGVESFVIVLGIGISIFLIAFFALSLVPESSKLRSPSKVLGEVGSLYACCDGQIGDTLVMYESNVGRLGSLITQHSISSLGNFEVGYALTRKTVDQKNQVEIRKGLFFSTKELEYKFNGNETTKALLTFDVNKSNLYGHLVIKSNGKVVYSNYTPNGSYAVEIADIDPNETNTLEVSAKSSGMWFWAPTLYVLKNVKLDIDKYEFKEKTLPFVISQEVFEKWSSGNVVFGIPRYSSAGNLIININGHNVHNKTVFSRLVSIPFSKFENAIIPGENLINFSADGKGYYDLRDVAVDVQYTGGQAAGMLKSFIIAEPHYNFIRTTPCTLKLKFTFKEISQAPVIVTFNDKDYEFPNLALQFPQNNGTATAELNLTINDVYKDFNIIKFRTNGVYDIYKVQFVAERLQKQTSFGGFFRKLN